jgi:hypothetical protein
MALSYRGVVFPFIYTQEYIKHETTFSLKEVKPSTKAYAMVKRKKARCTQANTFCLKVVLFRQKKMCDVDRQFSGGFRLMWQKKHNENRKVENPVYLFELLLSYSVFSRPKKKINLDG